MKNKKTKTGEMSFNEKASWSLVTAGLGIQSYFIMGYLSFFFTDVMLISTSFLAGMMLLVRVLDGVQDIGIGILVDRTNTKKGRFRPWYKWFAVPYFISCVLLFINPDLSMVGKQIYAAITYIICVFIYSCVQIPSSAQIVEMTKDSKEISVISSVRFLVTNVVSILFGLFVLALLTWFGGGNSNNGYLGMGIFLGAIGFATIVYAYLGTKNRYTYPISKHEKFSLSKQLTYLKNGPWAISLILAISLTLSYGINTAAAMYYFTYVVNNQALASTAIVILFAFMIPGCIVAPSMGERFGKKGVIILGICITIAGKLCMLFAILPTIFVGLALTGFGIGVALPLMQSLIPDIVDYGEWKHGKATPGILNSATSLGTKVGSGLAATIVLLALNIGGYVAAAPVQTDSALGAIRIAYIVLPLFFDLISLTAISFYRIGSKREMILQELKQRHAALADN